MFKGVWIGQREEHIYSLHFSNPSNIDTWVVGKANFTEMPVVKTVTWDATGAGQSMYFAVQIPE